MNKISELTAEIIRERDSIWQEAPLELENLKSHQKGRAGNASVRVYAFADAYRNQRNLWLLRDGVKNQNLTIESAKSVLGLWICDFALAHSRAVWQWRHEPSPPKDHVRQAPHASCL